MHYLDSCGADIENSNWASKYANEYTDKKDFISFNIIPELKEEFSNITEKPLFPFEFGTYLGNHISTYLDYSLKSCDTVLEIAELSTRFHSIRSNVVSFRLMPSADYIEFRFESSFQENPFWAAMLFASAALTHRFICNENVN